ncbi:MAG: acyloxyacyl hydrolase [Lentimicrobiaceae bacterium]|jgi:hypothetical protein
MRFIAELRKYYIFIVILAIPTTIFAQSDTIGLQAVNYSRKIALQVSYQNGYVFATNPFLKGVNAEAEKIKAYQAFSAKLSLQTTGHKSWEQLYKYPHYGVGLYVADFYNPEEIGVPIAVYGFFNAPFKRWNKLTFNYEIGFGATFNWKAYNPVTNQYNVAIGAGTSFLIDAGLNLEYSLTKKVELAAGFSLTHFSNGALRKPNFGINTFAPKVSLQYNFFDKPVFVRQPVQKYIAENEWLISAYGGIKNVIFDSVSLPVLEKYEGLYFPVFGLSTTFNRQVSHKSKIGFGATLSYNGAVNAQAAVENNELEAADGKFSDKILLSIYPSYELVINKVSLILQPAFYIYRKKLTNQSPVFHQRIGIKYHITDHIFIGITLVDYQFHVSDFIEWNVGYRIKWK